MGNKAENYLPEYKQTTRIIISVCSVISVVNRFYGILIKGVGQVVAVGFCQQRKVRTSQDRMPGNAWEVRAYGQCSRKYTACRFGGR